MEQPESKKVQKKPQKKLYRNHVAQILLLVFVAIVTALSVMGYGISRYKRNYYASATRSCNVMVADLVKHGEDFPNENMLAYYIPYSMNSTAASVGTYLYLFNTDGQCILCSANTGQEADGLTLSVEMLHAMKEKGTYLTDRSSGKFNRSIAEPMLCNGSAFTIQQDGREQTYYLFANTYTHALNNYVTDFILVTVLVSLAVLAIAIAMEMHIILQKAKQREQIIQVLQLNARGDYTKKLQPEQWVGSEMESLVTVLDSLVRQAERAESYSKQFVSNVSHELRTPMTIISGFVEGILDGTVPRNKRMEYLSIVSQEMQRLKMLVTSMLNLTKFDAGTIQINYQMFTMNDTAFRTVLMFENRLEKRHISVEGLDAPPLRVYADPDLMGQVVYNLVENAVKFVNESGTISFRFESSDHDWIFAVRNTGNGISKEELPRIFERFYKSDASRSQDKTGLGLGLDITKQIIHLHHAQISVRSEEHVYTEFEVRLPQIKPPHSEQESEETPRLQPPTQ